MLKAKFIWKILFVLQIATDDEPQDSKLGLRRVAISKRFWLHQPDVLLSWRWQWQWTLKTIPHELQVEQWLPSLCDDMCVTCTCTYTILTKTSNIESGMKQTEAMAVSLSLTNLSYWLSRGISSFNNKKRKKQKYQKGNNFHAQIYSFVPIWYFFTK